jgi:hypothetical protein
MSEWLSEKRKSQWALVVGILLCLIFLSVVIAAALNAPVAGYAFWREMDPADRDMVIVLLVFWVLLTKKGR